MISFWFDRLTKTFSLLESILCCFYCSTVHTICVTVITQWGHLLETELNVGMWKQFFNEKIQKPSILHKGSDVCGKQCDCGACPKEMFKTCLSSDLDNIYCPCAIEK